MTELIKQFALEFSVTLLIAFLVWLRDKFLIILSKNDPRWPARSFVLIIIVWAIAVVGLYFSSNILPPKLLVIGFLLISLPIFAAMWREMNRFWKVGVVGADLQVKKGIDYKKSLEMVHSCFSFLGTGASKLTLEPLFEEALSRCPSDAPIRFILMRPYDPNLEEAEKRAAKPANEYNDKVLASLRKIAGIRKRHLSNIEVRFYPSNFVIKPILRLAFIDNTLCLMSYNVFGEGSGSQLPQLHISKETPTKSATASFYYALDRYFQWLWEVSEPWDFNEYTDNKP